MSGGTTVKKQVHRLAFHFEILESIPTVPYIIQVFEGGRPSTKRAKGLLIKFTNRYLGAKLVAN